MRATQRTAHARSLLILLEKADLELIDSAAIQDVIGAAGRLLDEALAQVGGVYRTAPGAGPYHSRDAEIPRQPVQQPDEDDS